MTIQQEYHQSTRYGNRNFNSISGNYSIAPLYKNQDYINDKRNVVVGSPKDFNKNYRILISRQKENSPLIMDRPLQ